MRQPALDGGHPWHHGEAPRRGILFSVWAPRQLTGVGSFATIPPASAALASDRSGVPRHFGARWFNESSADGHTMYRFSTLLTLVSVSVLAVGLATACGGDDDDAVGTPSGGAPGSGGASTGGGGSGGGTSTGGTAGGNTTGTGGAGAAGTGATSGTGTGADSGTGTGAGTGT